MGMTQNFWGGVMKRIGLVGCGNIAALISAYPLKGEIVAVFDRHPERAERIAASVNAKDYSDFERFCDEAYDLVIETASVEAVQMYAEQLLVRGNDVMILSAGALADGALRKRLETLAAESGSRLHVPSGALFGLDNAKIAAYGGAERVTVCSTKPPQSLGIETAERRCLFKGDAADAVKMYPRNVNAAVALSIAAQKPVELELWADPGVTAITHEVHLEGVFGRATLRVENRPSPDHPSTSMLAALSVVALLNTMDGTLHIGT